MCGICGVINNNIDDIVPKDLIESMCDVMQHRGPDEGGFYLNNNVGLGIRRLKIIDLYSGSQPIFSEDKKIVTVFNGEIYNFRELREKLIKYGHHFSTKTDTEVIVHLYEQFNEEFLNYLNGMFAIALWDEGQKKLLLARDRLGEKPLHYMVTNKGISFASEIKSLMCCHNFKKELDLEALYHYFSFICIPAPFTIFKNIKKLPPGHFLIYQKGKVRIGKYWDFSYDPNFSKSEAYFSNQLRELMIESLRNRLISDVPLGAFLSGGIDSSVVVGLMSTLLDSPVKTFSIGFKEDRYNELEYARVAAKKFKTDHHELIVEPSVIDLVEKLIWHFDEPFGGPSAIPTFLVSKMAREYVTVVLTGDGGDEVFAGYDRYLNVLSRRKFTHFPYCIRRLIANQIGERLPQYFFGKRFLQSLSLEESRRYCLGLSESWKKTLFSKDFLRRVGELDSYTVVENHLLDGDVEYLSRFGYLDTKLYLPDNVLVKVDRMSMANSLEVRTLFLDHEIVEFAAKIPARLKLNDKQRKYILKKSMRDLIPEPILKRGKWGFALPVDVWFRGELKDLIHLSIEKTKSDGIFSYDYLNMILKEHMNGRRDNQRILWPFMIFQVWYEKYLEN